MAEDEKDYGFGQGENIVTVVQRTPRGTEVIQTTEAELGTLEVLKPDPAAGIEVEVIRDVPKAAAPALAALKHDEPPAPAVEFVPARSLVDAVAEEPKAAKKSAPKRETAKTPAAKTAAERVLVADPSTFTDLSTHPASGAVEKKREAQANFGPVGPDPKQEAAKSVPVSKSPTGPTGTKKTTGPTGPKAKRG